MFTLTNSADPDEMQHLWYCIWVFTVCQSAHFVVSGLNIHVQVSVVAQEGRAGKTIQNPLDWLIRTVVDRNIPYFSLGIT